ncbi:hypothetical protein ACQ4PT_042050 [Festuca glaucescens]
MAQCPDTFPESEVNTAMVFLGHVKARLVSSPAVYEDFLRLLQGFSTGRSSDPNAVKNSAYALLRGHPDLIRRLDVFFPDEHAPGPARQDPAPTRPKRERRPSMTPGGSSIRDVLRRRSHGRKSIVVRRPSGSPPPSSRPDNPSSAKRPRAEDRRTTSRRANSPAVVDAAATKTPFRESWEFETTYSKLVATDRRINELLEQYETPEEAPPPPWPARVRELFPDPECREVLREMYHQMLGPIRAALEDGARTELALKTIKRRLGMLGQLAVKSAMERRDPARVEGQDAQARRRSGAGS